MKSIVSRAGVSGLLLTVGLVACTAEPRERSALAPPGAADIAPQRNRHFDGTYGACSVGAAPGTQLAAEYAMANQIGALVNAQRAQYGLPALELEGCVSRVAKDHSNDEARQQTSAHVLGGKDWSARLNDADIARTYDGENIHSQWDSANGAPVFHDDSYPNDAVTWWMGSAAHRANILDTRWNKMGVGVTKSVEGPRGAYYGVLDFIGDN
jgi:uncharacterized protein YkwD